MVALQCLFGVLGMTAAAQTQEVGLTLGRILSLERSAAQSRIQLGSGTALQANYGLRLIEGRQAALYAEVHFLANPQRKVESATQTATRDVATLYVTPGLRVRFFPRSVVGPYLAIGGGYAQYEQSTQRIDGRPNTAPRRVNHGTLGFGGGVDIRAWRFISLRGEIRDFYSGSPAYNLPAIKGGQHNIVAGGGIVLRFH